MYDIYIYIHTHTHTHTHTHNRSDFDMIEQVHTTELSAPFVGSE